MTKLYLILTVSLLLVLNTLHKEWIMICTPDIIGGDETCEWKNV